MKSILATLAILTSANLAHAALPLDEIRVISITQQGNLMPPVTSDAIQTTIELEVMSGGCTTDKSFVVSAEIGKAPKFEQSVKIVRVQPDMCEAVPHLEKIVLKTNKLGAGPTTILNPVIVEQNFVY